LEFLEYAVRAIEMVHSLIEPSNLTLHF
jgi:hypothetical protein